MYRGPTAEAHGEQGWKREGAGERELGDWYPQGLSDHSKICLYEQLKGVEGF